MQHALTAFLKGKPEGQSSFSEFFNVFSRTAGVPPLPRYADECERLLTEAGLLTDGTVGVRVRGRNGWPIRETKHRDRDEE